jgi:hypothetical protein
MTGLEDVDHTCEKCGQWYVGFAPHDCRPDVPKYLSCPLVDADTWDRIRDVENWLIEQGITFDTGTGFGARDWQFEMLDAVDRLKVIAAAERAGLKTEEDL